MAIRITKSSQKNQSRVAAFFGGLICFSLSVVGFYVVFLGGEISGGIPFIPAFVNLLIGKIFIGFGAAITALLGIMAFYDAFKIKEKKPDSNPS